MYVCHSSFSSQEQAPTEVPFHYSDSRAVVVYGPDGHDDSALRLAYMWARWVVRRQLALTSGDDLDMARVSSLIEDAQRALERSSAVKRYHTQAKRGIEKAQDQVASLVSEVDAALDALCTELTR